MKWSTFFRKKKDFSDPKLDSVIQFIDDKIIEYTSNNHKMNQKERIEFDLMSDIMKIIRKENVVVV